MGKNKIKQKLDSITTPSVETWSGDSSYMKNVQFAQDGQKYYPLPPSATEGSVLTMESNKWTPVSPKDWEVVIATSDWTTSKNSDGWYTVTKNLDGIKSTYNPIGSVKITSAELAEAERTAMSKIIEIETLNGSIICKALELPETTITIKLMVK